ncbi:MAG: hypothetical protein Kow0074_25830 [Candidatus Zixiibacteriota bacterium]
MAPKSSRNLEQIEIHLRYVGPDVEDGSMSINDIVPVLQGFSGAYTKLARDYGDESEHNIRIKNVRPGSADIGLEVWRVLSSNQETIATTIASGIAIEIIKEIFGTIRLKRHTKKQPHTTSISAENSIVVTNAANVSITVPMKIYDRFVSGSIDPDLSKMTRPLEPGRIDKAELSTKVNEDEELREEVSASERQYFDTEEKSVTSTQEAEYDVELNAIRKSSQSGYVILPDGSQVYFKYVGDDPDRLYSLFPHKGLVRVRGVAHLDENLKVTRLDISSADVLQRDFF